MKFAKRKKMLPSKKSLSEKIEKTGKVPDWMKTDPEEVRELEEQQRAQMAANRPPEFFLKEDESRNIRFRSDSYIACIFQYSFPVPGKKYWRKVTQPDEGEVDLFAEAGRQAALRAVYEIIDISGYKDKKGKRVRNISRFWNVSMKQHEAIQKLREKKGTLLDREWSVSKIGSGKQSTMMIVPEEPSKITSEQKDAKSLKGEFQKYYAPPDEKGQKALLRSLHISIDSSEDSD
jgi:hypothetical protein